MTGNCRIYFVGILFNFYKPDSGQCLKPDFRICSPALFEP